VTDDFGRESVAVVAGGKARSSAYSAAASTWRYRSEHSAYPTRPL